MQHFSTTNSGTLAGTKSALAYYKNPSEPALRSTCWDHWELGVPLALGLYDSDTQTPAHVACVDVWPCPCRSPVESEHTHLTTLRVGGR
jgi:hypothetical protein